LIKAAEYIHIICPIPEVLSAWYFINAGSGAATFVRQSKEPLRVYRGKGCKKCFDMGYAGRTAIGEVLMLTPMIKELIMQKAQEFELKAVARKEGMKTLRENGIQKILEGMTTIEEVLHATALDEHLS